MGKQAKKESQWKLVDISDYPPGPGVAAAREAWQGKEVEVRMPSGNWRRGKVAYIAYDGWLTVVVYQRGTSGLGVGFPIERIPQVLRVVNG